MNSLWACIFLPLCTLHVHLKYSFHPRNDSKLLENNKVADPHRALPTEEAHAGDKWRGEGSGLQAESRLCEGKRRCCWRQRSATGDEDPANKSRGVNKQRARMSTEGKIGRVLWIHTHIRYTHRRTRVALRVWWKACASLGAAIAFEDTTVSGAFGVAMWCLGLSAYELSFVGVFQRTNSDLLDPPHISSMKQQHKRRPAHRTFPVNVALLLETVLLMDQKWVVTNLIMKHWILVTEYESLSARY